jgi:hypothetical protein
LTTFIDHRQRAGRRVPGQKLPGAINNGSIAKKVLDDVHPTEKLEHRRGDHAFAGVDIAEDRSNRTVVQTRSFARTFEPLNLTYSLVKEHLSLWL